MKKERNVLGQSYSPMDRILREYQELTTNKVLFSLTQFLSSSTLRIDKLTEDFDSHPSTNNLKKKARQFCERFGIWLPGSDYYLSCALYLFPTSPTYRMLPIIKNNAIDFYLNDVMGREVFPHLPLEKQIFYSEIKSRMSSLANMSQTNNLREPVEYANLETLREMEYLAPGSWFAEFVELYCYHIRLAHKDCNSSASEYILDVDEYIKQRAHISGMPHTVKLIEFSSGAFIHREELSKYGMQDPFDKINWIVSLIGCLMNDLFSFEKEVIDNQSDSNLVAILMLNDPSINLSGAIQESCTLVRDLLAEFWELHGIIGNVFEDIYDDAVEGLKQRVSTYLLGLKKCVQACWTWQVYTKRYKRSVSIWKETLVGEVALA
jgi:hypothetical protein